ncbi:MAG: NAD-dependent epimerase/dehydratase family protein [Actinomycetota bacterium]
MTRILIAGAGDIGLTLAARLVADGHDTTTLNRSGRGAAGATSFVGDLADPATLAGLPETDVVVFTTAPPTRDDAGYRLAYVDGPQRVLAALPSDPTRTVLTSTTGVYGVDDGSWIDASSPAEPNRATAEIVVEGETALAAAAPTCLVRASGIYGPGRGRLIRHVRDGIVGVDDAAAPRWTNRIHRDDLATALARVALLDSPPPAVIAVDDEPSPRDDVLRFLASELGVELGRDPDPASRPRGKRCRNDALRATGWAPVFPSYREGYPPLVAAE